MTCSSTFTFTFFTFLIILFTSFLMGNSQESETNSNDKSTCDKDGYECSDNNESVHKSQKKNKDETFKGHRQPFGESGTKIPIQQTTGYPDARDFFLDYVLPSVPVLLKGAATLSPAYHSWTDEFLLRLSGLEENRNVEVDVERGKKEDREGEEIAPITFHEFLKIYNDSDMYLVTDILPFMEPYFTLPCPLQCNEMNSVSMKHVMWFSSGGTKSVVHTDGEENINCLYRGNKILTMLDPAVISTGTVVDNVSGFFSSLDVDRVDLNRYPTLRGANFIVATMEPGDCLYIPRRWIHQVNSIGSNLAVNTWFHYPQTRDLLKSGLCTDPDLECDPAFNLGRIQHDVIVEDSNASRDGIEILRLFFEYSSVHGEASLDPDNPPMTKGEVKVKTEEFIQLIISKELDPFTYFSNEFETLNADGKELCVREFCHLVRGLDVNKDGILTSSEFDERIDEMWEVVIEIFQLVWKTTAAASGGDGGGDEFHDDVVSDGKSKDGDDVVVNKKGLDVENEKEAEDVIKGQVGSENLKDVNKEEVNSKEGEAEKVEQRIEL